MIQNIREERLSAACFEDIAQATGKIQAFVAGSNSNDHQRTLTSRFIA
jgi:hypothetical protein